MSEKARSSRRALPKGTGPILGNPPSANTDRSSSVQVEWLDPKAIKWPEDRITSEYDDERSAALRRSMAELGQQDAVGVIQLEDGSYEGAAGMNRCLAAIETGISQVLCVVRKGTHRDVIRANLATSINQSRANPLSEVEGIANAHYSEGLDMGELVSITGKTEEWIEERLLISHASPVVKEFLGKGFIGIGHAALLANIEGHAKQEEKIGLVLLNRWTVRELEENLRGQPDGDGETPKTPTRARQQPSGPVVCTLCKTEHEPAGVQRVALCNACSDRLKASPVPDGEVAVPLGLLRDAENVLAGSQAGAQLAERIAVLLEGVGHD